MESPIPIQRFSNSSLRITISPLPTINGRKVRQAPVSPKSPLEAHAVLRKLTNLLPYPLSWLEKEELERDKPLTAVDKREVREAYANSSISELKAALKKVYEKRVARCELPPVTHTSEEEIPVLVINFEKSTANLSYKGITVGMYVTQSKRDNYVHQSKRDAIRISLMALWTRQYLKST